VFARGRTPRGRLRARHGPGTIPAVPPPVLALFGPTGVGKTAVAIALADRLRARGERPVAVSADALQLYRGLETLTGAAGPEERARLEHRLVGVLPVTATSSAGAYARRAHAEIDGLLADGATPIVVGGTGLYLRAALADLDLRPAPPPGLRERWERELAAAGPEALHARLAERAPEAARRIAPRTASRLVRAHELLDLGQSLDPRPDDQLWTRATRHPTRLVALVRDRADLYARIDARVEAMVAAGAIDEVRAADAAGASATARKALGFAELLDADVRAMQQATRRYARRQLTWLRRLDRAGAVEVVDLSGSTPAQAAERILPG
jgi:tRNA dimethylallyltransferase